ncbi:MAG: AAA family ATPase, partial [Pirellulaceae bacterium]
MADAKASTGRGSVLRFERLDLIAFGPFSQRSVDFSNSATGVHFIYGPNEAGKSSMLRAITDLLYGF